MKDKWYEPETLYWNGDRACYTGNTQNVCGDVFYEIMLLDGQFKHARKLTSRQPKRKLGKTGKMILNEVTE